MTHILRSPSIETVLQITTQKMIWKWPQWVCKTLLLLLLLLLLLFIIIIISETWFDLKSSNFWIQEIGLL